MTLGGDEVSGTGVVLAPKADQKKIERALINPDGQPTGLGRWLYSL